MDRLRADDPETIGPFRLIARLGAGGMGVVFLGTRETERVAIKVVRNSFLDDPSLRTRFEREIDTLKKVSSPFVAQMVDSSTEGEFAWHAVEFVNGPTLRELVDSKGPLPEDQWWRLARQLFDALRSVHQLGIVHRDIKPANIIMSDTGPKLIDFGISQDSDATSLTMTGLVAGSPAWLSPEQLEGTLVTAGSDLYSLGSVLVFAATGRSPWGDETSMSVPVVYQKILSGQINLDGLTADQRDLVMSLQHPDPAVREFPPRVALQSPTPANTAPTQPPTRDPVSSTVGAKPESEASSSAPPALSPKGQQAQPDSPSPALSPGPLPAKETVAPVAADPAPKNSTRQRIVFASFAGVIIAALITVGVWPMGERVSFRGTVLYTTMSHNLEGSEPYEPGSACFLSFTAVGERLPVTVLNSNDSRVGQTTLYVGELVNGWTPDGEKTSEFSNSVWDECSFPFEIPVRSQDDEFTLNIGDNASVTLSRADLESGDLVVRLTYSGYLLSFDTDGAEAPPDPYTRLLTATIEGLDDTLPFITKIFVQPGTGELLVHDGHSRPYKSHIVDPATLTPTSTYEIGWVSSVSARGDYVAFTVPDEGASHHSLALLNLDSGLVEHSFPDCDTNSHCRSTFSATGDRFFFVQEGDVGFDADSEASEPPAYSIRVIDLDTGAESKQESPFGERIVGHIAVHGELLIVSTRSREFGPDVDTVTFLDTSLGSSVAEITTGDGENRSAARDFVVDQQNEILYFKIHVVGERDNELWAIDLKTFEVIFTRTFHEYEWFDYALSPNGDHVALSFFGDNVVAILDTASQEIIQKISLNNSWAPAFSAEGLLYVGGRGLITVFEPSG